MNALKKLDAIFFVNAFIQPKRMKNNISEKTILVNQNLKRKKVLYIGEKIFQLQRSWCFEKEDFSRTNVKNEPETTLVTKVNRNNI